ncbi:MAG: hypothetical protein L6300_13060 [Syntrophaceae bacterium]|nr:hypothetical protein [Syntrophaceae bacterium]
MENIVERAVLLTAGDKITPDDLPSQFHDPSPEEAGGIAGSSLEQVGRNHIIEVLRSTEGNRAKTATVLRINRTTLWRMMQKLNIQDGDFLTK